ncbi:MAG: hypothetical protein PHW08_13720 [Kiritimatiellae bacterium]|nr:hypothetical protein [Kiritimatiellia bacterium]
MNHSLLILIAEALVVYCLVLWAHAQRHRFGTAHFYALIGGLTAVMSWVTDAGMKVCAGGLTFYVGSTVFYTAILLGVFVIYVFDGSRTTRIINRSLRPRPLRGRIQPWHLPRLPQEALSGLRGRRRPPAGLTPRYAFVKTAVLPHYAFVT